MSARLLCSNCEECHAVDSDDRFFVAQEITQLSRPHSPRKRKAPDTPPPENGAGDPLPLSGGPEVRQHRA